MESEGSSKRSEDKLQSASVQNQAIQSGAAKQRSSIARHSGSTIAAEEKVVVQYGDHLVKGTAGTDGVASIGDRMRASEELGETVTLRSLETGLVQQLSTADIKAIFLVKTFEGNHRRSPIHFHTQTPASKGLWVRITFHDGELMEGIVNNTAAHVMQAGFTLIPTDPESNNKLIYVPKDRLTSFEVLGLRNPPQGRDNF